MLVYVTRTHVYPACTMVISILSQNKKLNGGVEPKLWRYGHRRERYLERKKRERKESISETCRYCREGQFSYIQKFLTYIYTKITFTVYIELIFENQKGQGDHIYEHIFINKVDSKCNISGKRERGGGELMGDYFNK